MREIFLLGATLACFACGYFFVSRVGAFFDEIFLSNCSHEDNCDKMNAGKGEDDIESV